MNSEQKRKREINHSKIEHGPCSMFGIHFYGANKGSEKVKHECKVLVSCTFLIQSKRVSRYEVSSLSGLHFKYVKEILPSH